MNTTLFSDVIYTTAKDSWEDTVFPYIQNMAKLLAKEGLDKLQELARENGKVLPALVQYTGEHFRHRGALTKAIRKLLPIDVRVKSSTRFGSKTLFFEFSTAQRYSGKTGKKDYNFPTYRWKSISLNKFLIYTNYPHLVAIDADTDEVRAFKAVLEFFRCTARCNTFLGDSYNFTPRKHKNAKHDSMLIDWCLEWAIKNPIPAQRLFLPAVVSYVFTQLPLVRMGSTDTIEQLKAPIFEMFKELDKLNTKELLLLAKTR